MNNSVDKSKRHFIRGIVKKKNLFYAPLSQVSIFCHRFPDMTAKRIGDMIDDALKELENNGELLNKVPDVEETNQKDGGSNEGNPEKEA